MTLELIGNHSFSSLTTKGKEVRDGMIASWKINFKLSFRNWRTTNLMRVGWQTSRLTLADFVPVLYLNESETTKGDSGLLTVI